MEAFALYLLKSVIWLSVFALVFLLFLKNERFFFLNRIFLIAGILTAFIFPFIPVHYTVILPAVENTIAYGAIANEVQNSSISDSPDTGLILMTLYLAGVLFVMTRFARQIRSIRRAIKKAEIISLYPVKLIRTNDYTSVFSFFSWVFVSTSITDAETKEIVNHEQVHIRQKHWFDLVLVELLCMIQWFNPLAWFYVRLIRQNHEYLADKVALQLTSDPAIYRAALLNQIVGSPVVSLANSFNYSLNKKRFTMMKNIISSPYRKMKILLILPVFAIVFYSFAKPEYSYPYVEDNTGNTNPIITLQNKEVKGTVVQQDGKPLRGAIVMVKGTTLGVAADLKGFFKLEKIPDDGLLVVTHVGFKSIVVKPVFTSDMTIKMVKDTVNLKSIEVPPPPPPPAKTGEKENNVPPPPPPPPTYDKDGNFVSNSLSETEMYSMKVKSETGFPPLIVIDGKISDQDLSKLDPNSIQSITVLKNESAIALYGDKGKDGVLLITTKNSIPPPPPPPPLGFYNSMSANGNRPLIVVDGIIRDIDVEKVDPETVESITVYKDYSAVSKYGEQGKNGVIIVTSKKAGSQKKEEPVQNVEVVATPPPDKDVFFVVEEMPMFPGGNDAMRGWIIHNLKYPDDAVKAKITGNVNVDFLVSSTGKVKNVTVSKPVYLSLDAEAIRVIASMPDWKPGVQRGIPVDVQMKVMVEFKLK